jgi:threonine aldolase
MKMAEVGDDGRGEDPTVAELEERAAELLGKEAGLFVPSGTMGNLIAQIVQVRPGQPTLAGHLSHMGSDEAASHTLFASMTVRLINETSAGGLDLDELRQALSAASSDVGQPGENGALVSVENAHARSMGQPVAASDVLAMADIAHEHRAALHMDGARLFNASVALGVTVSTLVGPADTATFCLSKGLSCPVGSVLVGTTGFVARARAVRKMLGGAMRQAGTIAAAGLVALQEGEDGMIERLHEDHANARLLAEGLAELPLIESPGGVAQPAIGALDPHRVRTNFVIFRVKRNRSSFIEAARERGMLLMPIGEDLIRAVTHFGISRSDIKMAIRSLDHAAKFAVCS